jgi:hypothetical protein
MAIRNTYENKTKCKQTKVLKRKGPTHWRKWSPFLGSLLETLFADSLSAQGAGMVAVESEGGGDKSEALQSPDLQKLAVAKLLRERVVFTLKAVISVIQGSNTPTVPAY